MTPLTNKERGQISWLIQRKRVGSLTKSEETELAGLQARKGIKEVVLKGTPEDEAISCSLGSKMGQTVKQLLAQSNPQNAEIALVWAWSEGCRWAKANGGGK